jgi:hypothetical protein
MEWFVKLYSCSSGHSNGAILVYDITDKDSFEKVSIIYIRCEAFKSDLLEIEEDY